MTACQPAPLPTAEVAAKAQPLRLDTACLRALQVGFAQEHDAYLKEYAISGEWPSDTYTAGWILTGFHQALPTEKYIARCSCQDILRTQSTRGVVPDSVLGRITQQDWLIQRTRKRLLQPSDTAYPVLTARYAELDAACQADPIGYLTEEMPGHLWVGYQLWAFDNYRHAPHANGWTLPAILDSRSSGMDEVFLQYRLVWQGDSVILFRTIFNHSVIGDPEMTW